MICWLASFFRKAEPKPETASEKVERLKAALAFNRETGEYEITREYQDAVIDEIIEHAETLRGDRHQGGEM